LARAWVLVSVGPEGPSQETTLKKKKNMQKRDRKPLRQQPNSFLPSALEVVVLGRERRLACWIFEERRG